MRALLAAAVAVLAGAHAFDNRRFDNIIAYWGQNSWGGLHPGNTTDAQKPLGFYCDNADVDVFPLAFLPVFFSEGGLPSLDLSNICSASDQPTFPDSQLPNCSFMASDIKDCQSKGKLVTLSLGGADAATTFANNSQAEDFAQLIWDLFLGGSSDIRPFGDAVLDGLDLDLEGGGQVGDVAFVQKYRSLSSGSSKQYYLSAAPQCPYPDGNLGDTLNAVGFDFVFVQFYNNYCSLPKFNTSVWNFGEWDYWARNVSPNPNVKVYIGAPGDSGSAGSGYVPAATLANDAVTTRKLFPSFGGAGFWDMSTAWADDRLDQTIKQALQDAGGTGFEFPACSAPQFKNGSSYSGGDNVTFSGYIWQAAYDVTSTPSIGQDWMPISACGSGGIAPEPSVSSSAVLPASSPGASSSTYAQRPSPSDPTPSPSPSDCASCAPAQNVLTGPQNFVCTVVPQEPLQRRRRKRSTLRYIFTRDLWRDVGNY